MSSKITFVAGQDSPPPTKRKYRSRKACEDCRKRKRRCLHASRQDTLGRGQSSYPYNLIWVGMQSSKASDRAVTNEESSTDVQTSTPPKRQKHGSVSDGLDLLECPGNSQQQNEKISGLPTQLESPELARSVSPPALRFVGDLNPEARLLDYHDSPEDTKEPEPENVGLWVQPGVKRKIDRPPAMPDTSIPWQLPRSKIEKKSDLLSDTTIKELSCLYFFKVHPIIPLLDEQDYWQSFARRTISIPLAHVVCLIAAKDAAAGKHLKLLSSRNIIVPVRRFCSRLYASISAAISQNTGMRKITAMRVLGLLSLHHEGSDGAEKASSYISQGIHYAQSLALHLPQPNDTGWNMKRTFWCLWTLDRLNSAINSRPCFIADMDIAVSEIEQEQSGFVAFNLWFRLAKILNKVIGLYRPNTEQLVSGWDAGFPGFEQIIDEVNAWSLPQSTLDTLHLFYLAIAILAHRLRTITTLPSPSPSRLRQQLSAIQVIRYMQDPVRLNDLHPFPIVVYATSLALSVSYQQLRYGRLCSDQEDSRHDFNTGCEILKELRRKWCSADAMAILANKISGALNKLPCLDVVRLNRTEKFDSRRRLGRHLSPGKDNHPVEIPTPDSSGSQVMLFQDSETMSLLAGMDDVSLMYLDAENPVCFDGFPEFDDLYNTW